MSRRHPVLRAASAGLWSAWLSLGGPSAASSLGVPQVSVAGESYEEILRGYQSGDADAAVLALARWETTVVERAARAAQAEESAKIVLQSGPGYAARLEVAAALHLEAGISSGARERFRLHVRIGEQAVRTLAARRSETSFCRTWFLSAAAYWTILGDLESAERTLRTATQLLGESPELLIASGSLTEMWSGPLGAESDMGGLSHSQRIEALERREPSALLRAARDLYQRALARGPGNGEARLRLGRVLQLLGRSEEASTELALCSGPAERPEIRYLAYLFSGLILERDKNYAGADAAYWAAVEALPSGFAARLALARIQDITGRSDLATATIAESVGQPVRVARPPDPWWLYQMGQLTDLGTRLRALRASARQH